MKFILTEFNTDRIITLLSDYGIAVLPSFYNNIKPIADECKKQLTNTKSDYGLGIAKRYSNIPKFATRLFDQRFKTLADNYFTEKYSLHHEIFITYETNADGHARNADLHFDRIHNLKFFYYLSDVDEACGPFEIVPSSHKQCKKLRQSESNKPYNKQRNRTKEIPKLKQCENKAIPILGPAGTLIIFDTDALHRGGKVDPGRERLILRSHCRATRYIQ